MPLRALRGATTVDADTADDVLKRVTELLQAMLERNQVDRADIVSIWFTATDDLHSVFPAAAARAMGMGDVPLICARELDIVNGTPQCIRVLMHLESPLSRADLRHVYLQGAKGLRDDLPG